MKARDVQTFTSTHEEGSAQLTDRRSLLTTLLYRYVYRRVQATDLRVAPEEIPLFNQPTQVSFFSFTWVRDRRDNAADPAEEVSILLTSTLPAPPLAPLPPSSVPSIRTPPIHIWARAWYLRARHALVSRSPLPANRIAGTPPCHQLFRYPLTGTLFAGGGTTLRGFGLNQAGPRDPVTGFPVGGLGMLIFNQQLQFPMRLPLVGSRVSGGFFYDAGNVFSDFSHISLRWAPPPPVLNPAQPTACLTNCTNELNYFSHTLGFGFATTLPSGL